MFKVTINYSSAKGRTSTSECKLIMKLMPLEDGLKKEMLKETPAFKNEIRMYTEVLPKMESLLASAGIKITFGPPLAYTNVNKYPSPVIVFKDVSPEGFASPEWGVMSYGKTRIAALTIAKFHAASLYLNEAGFVLTDFDEHFFKPKHDTGFKPVEKFFKPAVVNGAAKVKAMPGMKELGEKLEQNADHYLEQMTAAYCTSEGNWYNLLNHGDFHTKNLMYLNEGETQSDFFLIDYQFPIWGSPAVDIYCLLNIIADNKTRENRRDELIRLYYNEFAKVLRMLNFKGAIPTLLDLRIEMLRYSCIDLIQVLGFVGMQFIDLTKINVNDFVEDTDKVMHTMHELVFESEEYKAYLVRNLKRLDAQGTLG